MRRNRTFKRHEPFHSNDQLVLLPEHVKGPLPILNPTRAKFDHIAQNGSAKIPHFEFRWRSRDNRKGRHALAVEPLASDVQSPIKSSSVRAIRQGVGRMVKQVPYWDISYLVAIIFTLGSCVWVVNAFFVWLPLVKPSTKFNDEITFGGGISAFIGATIFELGSILLMLEAINEDRAGCFGWAVESVETNVLLRVSSCRHHHANRGNLVSRGAMSWQWWPSWTDLTHHYLHDFGFLAGTAQLCGASIFWISGFTALPGINDHLPQNLLDGVYWVPQIVGGSGFIVSGTLYMLETQEKWYKPAFGILGWHIGFWNLIGAIGFTLSGALGPAFGSSRAEYEAALATFWGSWAFLVGSTIQWYESLDKHPVEILEDPRGHV